MSALSALRLLALAAPGIALAACGSSSMSGTGASSSHASASHGTSAQAASTTSGAGGSSATSSSSSAVGGSSTSSSAGTTSSSDTSASSATASSATSSSSSAATSASSTSSAASSTSSTSAGGQCTWAAGPSSNNGEITCYWFGQGTQQGGGCPSYKTYCGYCGTESGGNNGGPCPTGITDMVPNTATAHFAAFPVGSFGMGTYCGMCVQVTYQGRSIVATIVDECASCGGNNHIDLSLSAAVALGLGQNGSTGDAMSGVTWTAVDCPVSSDIVAEFNNGYSGQVYFQNVAFPVAHASAGGHTANQAFGYWDFGAAVAGQSVTLTDTVGHTVTGTIPGGSSGSVGTQFPLSCM